MLYKNGQHFDLLGEKIKLQALSQVRHYQDKAIRNLTQGEKAFCKLIGPVCKHGRVRYARQVIVYVAAGISFRVDFVFKDYDLAIEIDGPRHETRKGEAIDAWRTEILNKMKNWTVLRFSNDAVINHYLKVRKTVLDALIDSPKGYKRHLLVFRHSYS